MSLISAASLASVLRNLRKISEVAPNISIASGLKSTPTAWYWVMYLLYLPFSRLVRVYFSMSRACYVWCSIGTRGVQWWCPRPGLYYLDPFQRIGDRLSVRPCVSVIACVQVQSQWHVSLRTGQVGAGHVMSSGIIGSCLHWRKGFISLQENKWTPLLHTFVSRGQQHRVIQCKWRNSTHNYVIYII